MENNSHNYNRYDYDNPNNEYHLEWLIENEPMTTDKMREMIDVIYVRFYP